MATPIPNPGEAAALAGLLASLRAVNAAAVYYAQVFGEWPRFSESVARILSTPLDNLEVEQVLAFAPLVFQAPGHE